MLPWDFLSPNASHNHYCYWEPLKLDPIKSVLHLPTTFKFAHTSNPQNQKLITIIIFWNLIFVSWHLIGIFCDTQKYIELN